MRSDGDAAERIQREGCGSSRGRGQKITPSRLLHTYECETRLDVMQVPTGGTLPDPDGLLAAFRLDKKYRPKKGSSGVRFVLLEDVGRPVVVDDVTDDELRSVLDSMGASV